MQKNRQVQPLGTDAYLHAGLYNFIIMSNHTSAGYAQASFCVLISRDIVVYMRCVHYHHYSFIIVSNRTSSG